MINSENIKKIYTYIFPLIFILNGYGSGIPGISIGAMIMNVFNVLAIIHLYINKRINKKSVYVYIFIISIYILTILATILGISKIDVGSLFITLIKHLTWLMSITLTASYFLDSNMIKKILIYTALICTVYLFIQTVSWNLLNIYMPNLFSFGFIQPLYEIYSAESYISYYTALGIARPASFFSEPSFYASFTILPIAYLLFDKDCYLIKNRVPKLLILILGMLVSTSTTGLVCTILLVFAYYIVYGHKNVYFIIFIFITILCIPFLWNILNESEEFIFISNKLMNVSSSVRIVNGIDTISNITDMNFLIGYGVGESVTNVYTNSIISLFLSSGITGIVIFFCCMLMLIKKNKTLFARLLLLIYIINCFVSGMMFNAYSIYLLSIIFNYGNVNQEAKGGI